MGRKVTRWGPQASGARGRARLAFRTHGEQPAATEAITGAPLLFRLRAGAARLLFATRPFTRLVHVWSTSSATSSGPTWSTDAAPRRPYRRGAAPRRPIRYPSRRMRTTPCAGAGRLLLTVTGFIGRLAAFRLTVDDWRRLKDPACQPACNISPVVSCAGVMSGRASGPAGRAACSASPACCPGWDPWPR
ncbi:respiratory nitrate reductase subunit gamma [Streptomyces sp. ID05-04B]|uniref:respiratory nitrate reductase subunit gamma n=1 Tax=Streptomyces sp. ID05-04B TaxID=3028661 RepID=UPI0020B11421|nr:MULTISPECIES: respiratory nitrate reductase subunit gamma [unclassified Streptomyces]